MTSPPTPLGANSPPVLTQSLSNNLSIDTTSYTFLDLQGIYRKKEAEGSNISVISPKTSPTNKQSPPGGSQVKRPSPKSTPSSSSITINIAAAMSSVKNEERRKSGKYQPVSTRGDSSNSSSPPRQEEFSLKSRNGINEKSLQKNPEDTQKLFKEADSRASMEILVLKDLPICKKNGEVKKYNVSVKKHFKTCVKQRANSIQAAQLDQRIKDEVARYIGEFYIATTLSDKDPESQRVSAVKSNLLVMEGQAQSPSLKQIFNTIEELLGDLKKHILEIKVRTQRIDEWLLALQKCIPPKDSNTNYPQYNLLKCYESLFEDNKKIVLLVLSPDVSESKKILAVLTKWSKITTYEDFAKENSMLPSTLSLSPYIPHDFYDDPAGEKYFCKSDPEEVAKTYCRGKNAHGYSVIKINGEPVEQILEKRETTIEYQIRWFCMMFTRLYKAGFEPGFEALDAASQQNRVYQDVLLFLTKCKHVAEKEYVDCLALKPAGCREAVLEKFKPIIELGTLKCTRFIDLALHYKDLSDRIEKIWLDHTLLPVYEMLCAGSMSGDGPTIHLLRKLHPGLNRSPLILHRIRRDETTCEFITKSPAYTVIQEKWYGVSPRLFPGDPNRSNIEDRLLCEILVSSRLAPYREPGREPTFKRSPLLKKIILHKENCKNDEEYNLVLDGLIHFQELKSEDLMPFCQNSPGRRRANS